MEKILLSFLLLSISWSNLEVSVKRGKLFEIMEKNVDTLPHSVFTFFFLGVTTETCRTNT